MSATMPILDLPASWRAAIEFCPYCSGRGSDEGRHCERCRGSGDLFGSLLLDAYRQGQTSVLSDVGQIRDMVALTIQDGEDRHVPIAQLKRSLGLGL